MFSIYYLINQIFYLVLSKHRSSHVTKGYPWIFGIKIVIVLLFLTAILLKRKIIFKVNKKYDNLWIIAFKKISFSSAVKQCNVIAYNILFFIYEKLYWNTYINKSFSMKVPTIIISMSYNRNNIDTRKIHLLKRWKIIAIKIKKEITGCFIFFSRRGRVCPTRFANGNVPVRLHQHARILSMRRTNGVEGSTDTGQLVDHMPARLRGHPRWNLYR